VLEEGDEPGREGGVRSVVVHGSVEIGGDVDGGEGREGRDGLGIGDEDLGMDERKEKKRVQRRGREGGGRGGRKRDHSPC